MGVVAKPLAALTVGRIKSPGYHAVGVVPGLYLAVSDSGARSWILRATVGTKRREIGLGPFPAVPLAAAHEEARRLRDLIRQGVDPVEEKQAKKSALIAKQESSVTFQRAAERYIDAHSSAWRNPKHGAQWQATLSNYAFPIIGQLHVSDIKLNHVLAVLEPIWTSKTETASRLRGRIERVLAWSTTRGLRSGVNPATWRGQLDTVLPAPGKVATEKHYPAVQISQAALFRQALSQVEGTGAKALLFALLTAARSGEVRGARWSEVNLKSKVWIVPKERMKAGREHRVPLSSAAMAVIQSVSRNPESDLIFASTKASALSDMTLSAVMRRMEFYDRDGRKAVPHGLRSTFRDWAAEFTSCPSEVVEAALAHAKTDKVEAAYFRSDLFDKRRRLLEDWSAFLNRVDVPIRNVTAIGAVRRLPGR
jgi:integrase